MSIPYYEEPVFKEAFRKGHSDYRVGRNNDAPPQTPELSAFDRFTHAQLWRRGYRYGRLAAVNASGRRTRRR